MLTSVWLAPQPTPDITLDLPDVRQLKTWTVPKDTSAVCDGIPVLWQNTDVEILALLGVTTISGASITGSKASNATPTSSSTTSSSSTSSKSSLSTGAKAAIGVMIPLAFIALVFGIFLFFRRRNSRSSHAHHDHHELPTTADSESGNWTHLSFLKYGHKQKPNELDSARVFEADEAHQIVEMGDGRDHVFEMADTSSIRDGKKDAKKMDTPSDGRKGELPGKEEFQRRNDGQDLLTPEQGHSRGDSELEIEPARESAPPSYTI